VFIRLKSEPCDESENRFDTVPLSPAARLIPAFLKKLGFSLSPADSIPGDRYDPLNPA
jgi:hypothetical protein